MKIQFLSFLMICQLQFCQASIERRCALDVGSGSLKLLIADVDTNNEQITTFIYSDLVSFPFSESLANRADCSFGKNLQTYAKKAIQRLLERAAPYAPSKVVGIATEAFRKAKNGTQFAQSIYKELKIPIYVISQAEEAEIAFKSVVVLAKSDPDHTVVWDIGSGSFQIAWQDVDTIHCYSGQLGQVIVRNILLEIQGKSRSNQPSPYPISIQEAESLKQILLEQLSEIPEHLQKKLAHPLTKVYGIGGTHHSNIALSTKKFVYTLEMVEALTHMRLSLNQDELDNSENDHWVSDLMLLSSIMTHLKIKEVIDIQFFNHSDVKITGNTVGILTHAPYWSKNLIEN